MSPKSLFVTPPDNRCHIFYPNTPTKMNHMYYFHVCRANHIGIMKGVYLGELEELVLLHVGILYPQAYGVAVMDEIEKQAGRSLNISAIHSVLTRLEEKGFLKSKMGDPSAERGGRRKRIFLLTAAGKRALEEANELRSQLFNQIPKVALQFRI